VETEFHKYQKIKPLHSPEPVGMGLVKLGGDAHRERPLINSDQGDQLAPIYESRSESQQYIVSEKGR
jgi:hypothetical protein